MLYECWGSLLEFSLLVKGLILRSDLGLAQEEGRQDFVLQETRSAGFYYRAQQPNVVCI